MRSWTHYRRRNTRTVQTGAEPTVLDEVTTGRILRIDADRTTGGNIGAAEIQVYASS